MKRTLILLVMMMPLLIRAQTETFGLATYTPLKGWKRNTTAELVQFTNQDAAKGTYCALSIFKASEATGDARENFKASWKQIVQGLITNIGEPETQDPSSEDGWEAIAGQAPYDFENTKGVAMLVTSSSGNKKVNILILTNTDTWNDQVSAFLESVTFKKEPPATTNQQTTTNSQQTATILGTWIRDGSINPEYADPVSATMAGYNSYQYTFNANGTYTFYTKNFRMTSDKLLLVRESGTFVISGDKITVSPAKSVIETWTKKDRGDDFGKMIGSQNRALEKTTYQFTKYYFTGIQEWNLVLLADQPTVRDGPYSNNKTFPNAWYFKAPGPNTNTIKVPGATQSSEQAVPQGKPDAPIAASGFEYDISNFEDGWSSRSNADHVALTKGNVKALLHFGITYTDEIRKDIAMSCWNLLAAGRYDVMKFIRPDFRSPWAEENFLQAEVTEKSSGRHLLISFLVVSANGTGTPIEVISPSAAAFDLQFTNASSMKNLASYNRFGLGKKDITGTWKSSGSSYAQYYNVYNGNYAGMNATSISDKFVFSASGAFQSEFNGASGMVGSQVLFHGKQAGTYVNSVWELTLTENNGKKTVFDAYFQAVKGGRILHLQNKQFTGDQYHLSKIN